MRLFAMEAAASGRANSCLRARGVPGSRRARLWTALEARRRRRTPTQRRHFPAGPGVTSAGRAAVAQHAAPGCWLTKCGMPAKRLVGAAVRVEAGEASRAEASWSGESATGSIDIARYPWPFSSFCVCICIPNPINWRHPKRLSSRPCSTRNSP